MPAKLEYAVQINHTPGHRFWFGLGLLVVGIIIWGLRLLETAPYRPPQDMSTFLTDSEIVFVRAIGIVFGIVWLGLLVGFVISFRRRRNA